MRRLLVSSAVLMSLLASGCGGAAANGGSSTTPVAAVDPCPNAGEARLGRVCWNPSGSRWRFVAAAPGGEYTFEVELLAANRVRATDHPAAGPATDEWFVDGSTLRVFLADRFVEYRGELTNGTVIVGQAINTRGETWEWRGDRMASRGSCNAEELQIGGSCFSISGTRWRAALPSGEQIVQFAPDGRLVVDRGDAEGASWRQEGARITFTLAGTSYDAQILSELSLQGQGWSAERVPSYPPPIH